MSSSTATRSRTQPTLVRALTIGATAGVIASLAMAAYAMIAASIKGAGFFTPLHHIGSLLAGPDAMMTSMEAAMAGDGFRIVAGTALVGAVIHMATGAGYGALFGAISVRLPRSMAVLAVSGLAYGLLVFAFSAFIALPLAAAVFGGGDPISGMAAMAGWGTFIGEHLLFGVVLGVLVAAAWRRSASATMAS